MEKDSPRDKKSRIQARLFESEWNNIMLKAKKATFTLALINQLFCSTEQTISDPIEHLQRIVMDEYSPQINSSKKGFCITKKETKRSEILPSKNHEPYDQELREIGGKNC